MYRVYFENFRQKVALTEEEQELIQAHLMTRKIRKKQYILREKDICKFVVFVEKGLLKSYSTGENGTEHIIQFAPENQFILDIYSFLTGEQATYNIQAVEDSELIIISKSSHETLLKKSHKYETFVRILVTDAYIELQQRLNANISLHPDELYIAFMHKYAHIAQRVPQHMIASYLGIAPETLSRIRRKIAGRNS